mgnify:CR=1 FL=1
MNNRSALNIILGISVISLGSAYFIEYVLNYKPCNLCLIERIPYFTSTIIIFLSFYLKKFEKFIFIFLSIIFLVGTIISFYHFGIEQGFFEESFVCTLINEINILNKEDLLKDLQKTIVSCKEVKFKILGLSLATINAILSLILSVITFKIFLNYEKNR